MKKASFLLLGLSVLSLSACETGMKKEIEENGRYWQRVDTTDSTYQRGPKAQQMLFQDMSRCTAELNEQERLGALRYAIPPETFDKDGRKINPDSPEGRMADWDSPERDGYLIAEHLDYHDFETCMVAKGWQRVKYLPYETVDKSRDTYLEAIGYERYRSKTAERTKTAYDNLNK